MAGNRLRRKHARIPSRQGCGRSACGQAGFLTLFAIKKESARQHPFPRLELLCRKNDFGLALHFLPPRLRAGLGWVLAFFEQSAPTGPTRPRFRSAALPEIGEGILSATCAC